MLDILYDYYIYVIYKAWIVHASDTFTGNMIQVRKWDLKGFSMEGGRNIPVTGGERGKLWLSNEVWKSNSKSTLTKSSCSLPLNSTCDFLSGKLSPWINEFKLHSRRIAALGYLTYLVQQPISSISFWRRKGGAGIVYSDVFPVMAFQQSTF